EIAKCRALAGIIDTGLDGLQTDHCPCRVLVAYGHKYGCLNPNRRCGVAGGSIRRNLEKGGLVEMQQPQTNYGVPKTEYGPRRAGGKTHQQYQLEHTPATDTKHALCRRH